MNLLGIAQLLQILLPLGAQVYNEIRNANSSANLPDLDTILAATDKNWDSVIAAAQAELAKLNPAQ